MVGGNWIRWFLTLMLLATGAASCDWEGMERATQARSRLRGRQPATSAAAATTSAGAAATPARATFTALVGATVWDGTGTPALADGIVLLAGDRIRIVGPRVDVPVPPGARIVDVTDKWIVPGLIDAHIHFFQSAGLYTRPDIVDLRAVRPYATELDAIHGSLDATLRRYLVSGVTAVVDVGGPLWNFEVRQRAQAVALAPRVAVAGPLISTVARAQLDLGDPPIIRAESPDRARTMVQAQLAHRPDLIKIWLIAAPDAGADAAERMMRAAIEEAHAAKVRVAVHATERESARQAVEAGADILVHSVHDKPMAPALIELLKSRGTIYVPALVVMEGYAEVLGGEPQLTDVELAYADPAVVATWQELGSVATPAVAQDVAKRARTMRARWPIMRDNLKAVSDAGVVVAAGTDAGNIGTPHGPALHRELELMQQAGLGAEAVLLAATRDAARVFAAEPAVGTLQPGKLADLLVLDADPLDAVANLRRIHRVVKGGLVLAPAEILSPSPASVVQGQLDAYNARDLERFLSHHAPRVLVVRRPGGAVVAEGREAMRAVYAKLFATSPDLHCRLLGRVAVGSTVVDRELVTGIAGRPYVPAVAIYTVEDGLIARVELESGPP
ncbi:MAG: amidohydrolase family protein [Deltaproteobacteria bacterium]|nr:amidohydrolase family protein [Deltaproteobacteria bacterium]